MIFVRQWLVCFDFVSEPKIKKPNATPRFTNSTMKVMSVAGFVSLANKGYRHIASKNPKKFATTLIRPQLIVSPTPSAAVYSTASSYATKRIGSKKKPRVAHDANIRVLSALTVAIKNIMSVAIEAIQMKKAAFIICVGYLVSTIENIIPPGIPNPKTKRPISMTNSCSVIPYGATNWPISVVKT